MKTENKAMKAEHEAIKAENEVTKAINEALFTAYGVKEHELEAKVTAIKEDIRSVGGYLIIIICGHSVMTLL